MRRAAIMAVMVVALLVMVATVALAAPRVGLTRLAYDEHKRAKLRL